MAKTYEVYNEASTRQVPDKYPASLWQIIMFILTSCALYNTIIIIRNKEYGKDIRYI